MQKPKFSYGVRGPQTKIKQISQLYRGTFGLTSRGGWVPYQNFGHFPKVQPI